MGHKEVLRVNISEVTQRWQAGNSRRRIASGTGLSKDTVGRYISAAEALAMSREGPAPTEGQLSRLAAIGRSGPRQSAAPTEDKLAPWADQVYQWLTGDRLQVTRVQELLAERGCRVSYASLHRFVARRNWRRRNPGTVRMAESAPGEVAELDFGRLGLVADPETGHRRTVWALIVVLAHCRHSFVWPTFSQKLEDVIAGLEVAWSFFGSIPRDLVMDNFAAAVAGVDALHPRFTRSFLECSQHRGFICEPVMVRHPKDKPRVERSVQYVRERFFKGGNFSGLAHLREESARWCRDVAGRRVHGTTRRQPLAVFPGCLPWLSSLAVFPGCLPWLSSLRRSDTLSCPGTKSPTRSPTGGPSRCIPITTWPASTPSTRCRRPSVRRGSGWRSGWAASWRPSTTGEGCSSSIPVRHGAAAPPMPPTTRPS